MALNQRTSTPITTLVCVFLLVLPITLQAASDEELAAIRAQILALSERLNQLEAENRELAATNAELLEFNKKAASDLAEVKQKPATIEAKTQTAQANWTDKIRWQGDFRYRFESFDIEGEPEHNRNRVRARAALIADVTPTVEVGLGLASGGDDPVSSNQTLGGGGSTKELRMDLAYFDWSGIANTRILGGKFSNFIHRSGKNGLLWDSDWRPEGSGINWDNGQFFAHGVGTWIESDSNKDQSFAYLTQAGFRLIFDDSLKLTAGVGYHVFDTRGSRSFFGDDNDFFGNSFNPVSNTYLYDYEEVELFADLSFDIFGHTAQVFGNYVQNQAVDEFDTAYALGFRFGAAKNKGQWEFGYVYQELEADSVLGLLTDSDFGGGGTDSNGHIFRGSYAIANDFNAKFTYFINDVGLKSGDPIDFNRLQLDLSFKY